jgi:delta8-fatty-acid desaturase
VDRFHTEETKKSMSRYQIGVIEGKWDNITPRFQRALEGKNILELGTGHGDDVEGESAASSKASSVFESEGVRVRRYGTESPASSLSSSIEDLSKGKEGSEEAKVKLDEDAVVASFRELVADLEKRGLYDCNYWAYLTDVIRISIIFAITLLLLHFKQYILSSIFMGTFWHRNSPLSFSQIYID